MKAIFFIIIIAFFSCENDASNDLVPSDNPSEIVDSVNSNGMPDEEKEVASPSSPNEPTDDDSSLSEAEQMLMLVNAFRKESGVSPLTLNSALNRAAFKHSKDMNDNNYFDHKGKDGSSFSERTKRESYQGFPIGENIAIAGSLQQTFKLWRESDGHRKNMLNAGSNEMGLGKDGRYWTQIFGKN